MHVVGPVNLCSCTAAHSHAIALRFTSVTGENFLHGLRQDTVVTSITPGALTTAVANGNASGKRPE